MVKEEVQRDLRRLLWECPSAPSWAALLNPSSALPSLEEDFITWREQFWPAVCEHFGVEATGEESRWVPEGSTPCKWWLQHQAGATAPFLRAGGRTGSRSVSGALRREPVLGQIRVQLWISVLKGGFFFIFLFFWNFRKSSKAGDGSNCTLAFPL